MWNLWDEHGVGEGPRDDHWLCDVFDEAIQRDHCGVRLDDSGRIISPDTFGSLSD